MRDFERAAYEAYDELNYAETSYMTKLWWAIDAAWRDENGALNSRPPTWYHVLEDNGAIVSRLAG